MDIIVKGRHTGVSDRFREHVTTKLARIERLDNRLIRADVEVSKERNPRMSDQRERVELTIRSRGPAIRAEAAADDRFSALDIALGKLEARLRRLADRRKIHHGKNCPPSVGVLTAGLGDVAPEVVETPPRTESRSEVPQQTAYEEPIVPIEMDGEGPVVVREKFHEADPITIDQALLEMELVGHDFYLFRDKESGQPSVVYRRRGYNYGVLRLVER
ncbi:ribosome-associated translation inhibitor RaiA [Microtetraspora sp. AC03309]|uniref:ribosome hibernation-promoting factor, HPF/YfiA family n=1 Tax=Microtetraspora sp. AC03309 TaxID=2779376 RepID=UPI0007730074|nr:ribosome-associated translation inhibitor RaiA [Microtetraspora sp. AC03309]MCC5579785.1 ribosome-associated translation inhibitor RaiA [Microtetraspora sp. AC03309]